MNGVHARHGGRLAEARARFGGDPRDWLDLSTGINPRAWAPRTPVSVDWRPLPDPTALAELERAAARHFGTEPHLCLAVPGSESGLRALGHVLQLPGEHRPLSYSTHAAAFPRGAGPGRPGVLVIANPNNPDGTLTPRRVLLDALAQQEANGGWLLVDEAFADCMPEWSVAREVAEHRRLIVTRSFGKFFGLAGVRLGFVLGPTHLLAELRHLHGEWPVCAVALSFGTSAYGDIDWIERTRAALPVAARSLDAVLRRHGLHVRGACPLFRLVDAGDAHRLFRALARQHILTRPFDSHPRLLRLGLPPDATSLARLDAALDRD